MTKTHKKQDDNFIWLNGNALDFDNIEIFIEPGKSCTNHCPCCSEASTYSPAEMREILSDWLSWAPVPHELTIIDAMDCNIVLARKS